VKVGEGPSAASHRLDSPAMMRELMERALALATETHP
jgi:hypothetical protein